MINIHHVELALAYADRIIGIRAGKIVYDGPSADVTEGCLNMIYAGKIPMSGGKPDGIYDKIFQAEENRCWSDGKVRVKTHAHTLVLLLLRLRPSFPSDYRFSLSIRFSHAEISSLVAAD